MANMLFANNANTTLASSLTNSATTMSVVSASAFPSPTGSQYFYCTLADAATQTTIEIVKVTAVSGTTFTIVRGQDGTTGTIFASGAVVSLRLVAASLNDFPKLDEANTFTGTITFSTPLLATNMVQSTTSTSGYLSNTDWTTFNGKAPAVTYITGYVPFGQGTTTLNQSSNLFFNGSNLGIGTTNPTAKLYIVAAPNTGGLVITDNTSSDFAVTVGASTGVVNVGSPSAAMAFTTTNTERMRISSSGGVSIGNTTDAGATNLSVTGTVVSGSSVSASGEGGFYSTTFVANAQNPIWRFGNATSYGISYFQGTSGISSLDTIGFHFGTATAAGSLFQFLSNGNLKVTGTISPQQAATASAPAYVKGAIYFDTTLNKLRVGGATAWETITSV